MYGRIKIECLRTRRRGLEDPQDVGPADWGRGPGDWWPIRDGRECSGRGRIVDEDSVTPFLPPTVNSKILSFYETGGLKEGNNVCTKYYLHFLDFWFSFDLICNRHHGGGFFLMKIIKTVEKIRKKGDIFIWITSVFIWLFKYPSSWVIFSRSRNLILNPNLGKWSTHINLFNKIKGHRGKRQTFYPYYCEVT